MEVIPSSMLELLSFMTQIGAVLYGVPKVIVHADGVPEPRVTTPRLSVPVTDGDVPQVLMTGVGLPDPVAMCPDLVTARRVVPVVDATSNMLPVVEAVWTLRIARPNPSRTLSAFCDVVATDTGPAKDEVAVVVAVRKPTVGDDVAPSVDPVSQKVRALGEPPERDEPPMPRELVAVRV